MGIKQQGKQIQINYDYKHVPTLERFSDDNHFIRGCMGPFGSGKTVASAPIEIIARASAQARGPDGYRRTRWAVIRNTRAQLKDTVVKTFLDWLPPEYFGKFNWTDLRYNIEYGDVRCEIMFLALDKPKDVRKLLSLELTGGYINEAREVPRVVFNGLQARVGRYPSAKDGGPTWWGLWMDTNPPDEDHWWYELFEEIRPANAILFKQPSGLSPEAENIPNLPLNYYANLMMGKDQAWIDVYIHGKYGFIQDGKPVFPEYNDTTHCSVDADAVDKLPVITGWDFGLTPAVAMMQELPNGRILVFDELTADNMGIARFGEQFLNYFNRNWGHLELGETGADPAGVIRAETDEKACYDILNAMFRVHKIGVTMKPGKQALQTRFESVKWGLNNLIEGKPALIIHPRCKMLRKALAGKYKYRKMNVSAADKYEDKPDKNEYSHIAEALQYPLTNIFGGQLVRADNSNEYDLPVGQNWKTI